MWEAERDFEFYEDVQEYDIEDEGTGDFLDVESEASSDEEEDKDGLEFGYDFYDDEDRY
jgi:hypothetical protein